MSIANLEVSLSIGKHRVALIDSMLQLTCAGLNFLYSGKRSRGVPRSPTALHRQVGQRLLKQLLEVLKPLAETPFDGACSGAFARAVGRDDSSAFPELKTSCVDLLSGAGQVDPIAALDGTARRIVEDPKLLFGKLPATLPKRSHFPAGARAEYVQLVARQLRAGRVGLTLRPKASASLFMVEKKKTGKQRVIFNGGVISEAAEEPPKPP